MSINVMVGLNGTFEAVLPPPTATTQEDTFAERTTPGDGYGYATILHPAIGIHGGSWCGFLTTTYQKVGDVGPVFQVSSFEWTAPTVAGRLYTPKLWIVPGFLDTGYLSASTLHVAWRPSGGAWTEEDAPDPDGMSGVWEEMVLAEFEATTTQTDIRVRLQQNGIRTIDSVWFVDDVQLLGGDMAKTVLITDAIVSDLGDISTSNGFVTEVAEVSQEPKTEILYPGLSLRPLGSGEADLETLTNRMGQAVQVYEVACHVKSSTPYSAMQNLFDDVRNSIERSSSAVLALGDANYAVRDVVISEWSSTETSTDIDLYKASMTVTVEVTYTYNRGSL